MHWSMKAQKGSKDMHFVHCYPPHIKACFCTFNRMENYTSACWYFRLQDLIELGLRRDTVKKSARLPHEEFQQEFHSPEKKYCDMDGEANEES